MKKKRGGKRKTTEQFIREAIAKHGNFYDYSKVVYINAYTKVIIVCPTHGEFLQTPSHHLVGRGCMQCHLDRLKKSRTTEDMMIERAREVHGKTYWYNLSDYKGWKVKIDILCSKHGMFSQTPLHHIYNKNGCPECSVNRITIPGNPGFPKYQTYWHKLLPVHSPVVGEHGELLVPCYVCGEQFAPSPSEASSVCRSLVTLNQGVGNFYCSDTCKKNDPDYYKHHKPLHTDHTKTAELARKMTVNHRLDLLNVQITEYGYTFCECCGKNKDNLELHHTIRVVDDPWTAMNLNTHMIVCKKCHGVIHNRCRLPTMVELQKDIDNGGLNDLSDESIRIRIKLLQDQIDSTGHSFCNHCNTPFSGKAHRNKELYLAKDPEGLLNTSSEDNLLLCFRCVIKLYKEYRYNRKLNVLLSTMSYLKGCVSSDKKKPASRCIIPGKPGHCSYKCYSEKLLATDNPSEGKYGELLVDCKYCGKIFAPTRNQVTARIAAINVIGKGECNFYCSDECKSECSVYGKRG